MKILHINDTTLKIGGAETYLYSLTNLFKEKNHQISIFGDDRFESFLSIFTRFYNPFIYFKLMKKIKDFKPDIIHCHNIIRNISPSVLHAAKKHNLPIVMTIHDFQITAPKIQFIYKRNSLYNYRSINKSFITTFIEIPYNFIKLLKIIIHRKIIKKNVDFFITPSKKLEGCLKDRLGVTNIITIPNFVKTLESKPIIKNSKIILYVGKLRKEKGVSYLIKSIPFVKDRIPNLKLYIVGDGPEEKKLIKLTKTLNIQDTVKFFGWINKDQLDKFYEKAEIVCVPSLCMENCPLVVLEAISYGKPVIATNVGGLPELIKKEMGFLFEPRNADELSNKLVKMLSNFNLIKKMSINSFKSSKSFNSEDHYENIMKVYFSLIKNENDNRSR